MIKNSNDRNSLILVKNLNDPIDSKDKLQDKEESENEGIHFPIPGLERTSDRQRPIACRMIWIMILVFCSLVCFYQVGERIISFASGKTLFQNHIFINETVRLPLVTICMTETYGSYKFRKSFAEEKGQNPTDVKWFDYIGYQGKDVNQVWETYKTSEIIKSIKIDPSALIGSNKLSIKRSHIVTYFGFCDVLDLTDNLIRYEFGHNNYVRIVTTDFVANYPGQVPEFKFRVHAPSQSVVHSIVREGTWIVYGHQTSILVNFVKVMFLNSSSNPCYESDIFRECEDKCINQLLLKSNIKCKLPFMIGNLPFCSDPEATREAFDQVSQVYARHKDCSHCGRKCIEEQYLAMPTPVAVGNNGSIFDIYYATNMFTIKEEVVAKTLVGCISEVGGCLGLYLGFCILYLVEIVDEIVADVFRRLFKKSK